MSMTTRTFLHSSSGLLSRRAVQDGLPSARVEVKQDSHNMQRACSVPCKLRRVRGTIPQSAAHALQTHAHVWQSAVLHRPMHARGTTRRTLRLAERCAALGDGLLQRVQRGARHVRAVLVVARGVHVAPLQLALAEPARAARQGQARRRRCLHWSRCSGAAKVRSSMLCGCRMLAERVGWQQGNDASGSARATLCSDEPTRRIAWHPPARPLGMAAHDQPKAQGGPHRAPVWQAGPMGSDK